MFQEEEREEMCQQRGVQTAVKHHGSYEQPQEAGVSGGKHNSRIFAVNFGCDIEHILLRAPSVT